MEKEKKDEENLEKLHELINDQEGTGRSFECNFCKRGFTNAQALGGHMNIHRKDKAKSKSKSKPKPKHPSFFPQKLKQFSTIDPPPLPPTNSTNYYRTNPSPCHHNCIPGQTTNYYTTSTYHSYIYHGSDSESTLLSLKSGSSRVEDGDNQKEQEDDDQNDTLDLELRLGRN